MRNVAQRLFDNYQTHSEDMKKKQEDGRRLLQVLAPAVDHELEKSPSHVCLSDVLGE